MAKKPLTEKLGQNDLAKMFYKYADHNRLDIVQAFEKFLDFVIDFNAPDWVKSRDPKEAFAANVFRAREEQPDLLGMMLIYLDIIARAMEGGSWTDPLGDLYMDITSRHKSSRMGQFFTPEDLCTLMAEISLDRNRKAVDDTDQPITVNEPTAGSGRNVLAFEMSRNREQRCYYVAEELDPICAKMCACNMMAHGLHGMVIQRNTILLDFITAYYINEVRYPICTVPFVSIRRMTDEKQALGLNKELLKRHRPRTTMQPVITFPEEVPTEELAEQPAEMHPAE